MVPWEAGDLCWWWRTPRSTDEVPQPTWFVADAPVAAVRLTAWPDVLAVDVVRLPGDHTGPSVDELVAAAAAAVGADRSSAVSLLDEDGRPVDPDLDGALRSAGWSTPAETTAVGWSLSPPRPRPLPDGLRIVSVGEAPALGDTHLARRSGPAAGARLRTTPLHDPSLALCVLADDEVVAYAHGWPDTSAGVGLIEPVRVEDDWQRQGIATALVASLVERLRAAGCGAVRIGWVEDGPGRVYERVGFERVGTMVELADER